MKLHLYIHSLQLVKHILLLRIVAEATIVSLWFNLQYGQESYVTLGWWMNHKLEGFGRKRPWPSVNNVSTFASIN
jgi:hypothetical protein